MKKHFTIVMTLYCFFQFSSVLNGQDAQEISEQHGTYQIKDSIPPVLNSDLITTDEKGTKVDLLIKPVINDVFRYKIHTVLSSTERSTEIVSFTQEINYFFSEEVTEISSAGIITYKIKFDSIIVVFTDFYDSSQTFYNSNMKNYVWHHPDYIHYGNFVNEEFFARVSPKGDITSIYGMEKMLENLFSALGDTLNINDKKDLTISYNQEYFMDLIQPQFTVFPEKIIYKDSGWTRTFESELTIFPVENSFKYRLTDIKQHNDQYFISVDAVSSFKVLEKKITDENVTYLLENSKLSNIGNYEFNLSKGCLVKKNTDTSFEVNIKISDKENIIRNYQVIKRTTSINLMQ